MAGDWLPIRHDLPSDPGAFKIARLVDAPIDEVVGFLVRWFSWVDRHVCHAGSVTITRQDIDRESRCDGFADALIAVGWLTPTDKPDIFVIPHFDRWFGRSAKSRLQASKRQSDGRSRDRLASEQAGNCHASVAKMSRSHRDKNATTVQDSTVLKTPLPPGGGTARKRCTKPGRKRSLFRPQTPELGQQCEALFQAYPRRVGKIAAMKAIQRVLLASDGLGFDDLLAAVKRYAKASESEEQRFIKHPATWMNAGDWQNAPDGDGPVLSTEPLDPDHERAALAFMKHNRSLYERSGLPCGILAGQIGLTSDDRLRVHATFAKLGYRFEGSLIQYGD